MALEKYPEEGPLLIGQGGAYNGHRWAIRDSVLVGREPDCDIVIADRQVSRHHARLYLVSDGVMIEDLDSKNGTHRNGRLIGEPQMLQDGDIIQIAVVQQFVFLSSDSTIPLEGSLAEAQSLDSHPVEQLASHSPGRLRLDKRSHRVWIRDMNEKDVELDPPLSAAQFRLLELLYDHPDQVISRQEIVRVIWKAEQSFEVSEQALDALVRRLRDRLNSIDPNHDFIITVRGHGLRLENPPA